jgi:hypothetical protein
MLIGNSDLVMRQEQYNDLLREAKQARFIQANGLDRLSAWRLSWNLTGMVRSKFGKPQRPAGLKRAVL